MQLGSLTWQTAEKYFQEGKIAVIPLGSMENHGSHLPLGTDYIVPEVLAGMVEKEVDILVLPVMPFGVCPHHASFPGTLNIGYEALFLVMKNLCFSLFNHGLRKFVFLNGHGGNDPVLDAVSLEIYQKGGLAAVIDWWSLAPQLHPAWGGGHGDGQETAAMLAIKPEWVRLENYLPFQPRHLSEKMTCAYINGVKYEGAVIKVMRDVRDVTPSGWFGSLDPRDADADTGKAMLEQVARYIAEFIKEFQKVSR